MNAISKKTKIVATIGPGSEPSEVFSKLVSSGLNIARLNMSHGDHEEHGARIKTIRAVSKKMQTPIGILLDLSGPKIRTGDYETERITIEKGKTLILTSDPIVGNAKRIYVNYAKLPQEVKKGSLILVDDGKKKLQVAKVVGNDIYCTVLVGGELKGRRGINVPGAYLSIPTITAKDKKDIMFAVNEGVDLVALSFVRRASDVVELKRLLKKAGKDIPVISKIETQESIENLSAILEVSDGAMVARGDLASEVPTEEVPLLQKRIIRECNALGKPVITATQMLESMIHSPVPTRAEVSDVANAIFDGTDAVMLSEETTLGEYPVEAVSMMARIAETVESTLPKEFPNAKNIVDTVSHAVVDAAERINAKAIIALTESGSTARLVARFKPHCSIIALSPHEETVEQLALVRGVLPFYANAGNKLEAVLNFIPKFLKTNKLVQTGDRIVITVGLHFGESGATNSLFVLTV